MSPEAEIQKFKIMSLKLNLDHLKFEIASEILGTVTKKIFYLGVIIGYKEISPKGDVRYYALVKDENGGFKDSENYTDIETFAKFAITNYDEHIAPIFKKLAKDYFNRMGGVELNNKLNSMKSTDIGYDEVKKSYYDLRDMAKDAFNVRNF